jgi:DNA polymerase lambda
LDDETQFCSQTGLEVVACGSYRREKPTCGDLDILITHRDAGALEGLFENLLNALHESNFLTADLSRQPDGRQKKYLGVCRLSTAGAKHRRLDLIVVPYCEKVTDIDK